MSNQVGGRIPVVVTSSAQWHAIPRARGGPEAMDVLRRLTRAMLSTWLYLVMVTGNVAGW